MITIIDYGMGNIHSVQKALEFIGAKTNVSNKPSDINSCDKVVLPGVGAFADAILELEKQGLVSRLLEYINSKKPFLGICLGMQILFTESEEANASKGLGILKGRVRRFKELSGLKVPHMGWNQIKTVSRLASYPVNQLENKNRQTGHLTCSGRQEPANRQTKKCPLLKDILDNSYVYFCHSYYPVPDNESVIAATTDYGTNFASIVWQDNVYGVQFHPEKSQSIGVRILKNFVDLC